MKMKAYSLYSIGDLRYEDRAYPVCEAGWCVVRVKAAGICSSDIPRIFERGTYHFPTIPGHEFAGVVDTVAEKENDHLIGKKVGVFPLIPCRKCDMCFAEKYEMCRDYDYLGSRRDGGFAEYVAVPVPLAVSLHAIKKLNISKNEKIGIIGTGVIAFAAAQWAKMFGARSITVLGRTDNKRRIANHIGGIKFDTYTNCDREFDAVLEAVGTQTSLIQSINITRSGGRIVLMGNPEGDMCLPQNDYWKILRKQLSITGTWNSSYKKDQYCDWQEVKNSIVQKKVNLSSLVSHTFDQGQLGEALNIMVAHKEPYCR